MAFKSLLFGVQPILSDLIPSTVLSPYKVLVKLDHFPDCFAVSCAFAYALFSDCQVFPSCLQCYKSTLPFLLKCALFQKVFPSLPSEKVSLCSLNSPKGVPFMS